MTDRDGSGHSLPAHPECTQASDVPLTAVVGRGEVVDGRAVVAWLIFANGDAVAVVETQPGYADLLSRVEENPFLSTAEEEGPLYCLTARGRAALREARRRESAV
jgi:hypothetical protein